MNRIALLAPLALLTACHRAAEAPSAAKAWVRLPAVAGNPAAAYVTIGGGRHAVALIRVESALAQRIELHESMATDEMSGMAMMRPLDRVDVPAGGTVKFTPGAKHLMVIGLDPAVKPGTAVPLRFGFSDGSTTEAEAKTVAAGEDAPY